MAGRVPRHEVLSAFIIGLTVLVAILLVCKVPVDIMTPLLISYVVAFMVVWRLVPFIEELERRVAEIEAGLAMRRGRCVKREIECAYYRAKVDYLARKVRELESRMER